MNDEKYMQRCLQLAANGWGQVAPNPMVGAVIVHNDKIIGEGYHIKYGGPHAEVNAVNSVKDKALLKDSTIYVSLEPCAHYGKTPPCAELLIKEQIPRIVVACKDPFSKVAGKGIQILLDAGREVKVGILEREALWLNRRFITFHAEKRPYITLKWAESADKKIDVIRTNGQPVVLSSPLTAMLVHRMRSTHQAIMVGTKTAILDNPSLTTRHWCGTSPLRIVVGNTPLSKDLHLCSTSPRTLQYGTLAISDTNIPEYIPLPEGKMFLKELLQDLYEKNIQTLMVEGGSHLLQSFIDAELWDEMVIEECPQVIGQGISSPIIPDKFVPHIETHFGHRYRKYFRQQK